MRQVAGTHNLSRSALSRHKQRHGTVEGVREELKERADGRYTPIEVHAALTHLHERLDGVLKANLRTPARATSLANVAREARMALEAIARLQADPRLLRAAQLDLLRASLEDGLAAEMVAILLATMSSFIGTDWDLRQAVHSTVSLHIERLVDMATGVADPGPAPDVHEPARAWRARKQAAEDAQARIDAERFEKAVDDEIEARLQASTTTVPAVIDAPPARAAIEAAEPEVLEGEVLAAYQPGLTFVYADGRQAPNPWPEPSWTPQ